MATPLEPSSNADNGQQGGGALQSPNVTRAGSGGLTGEATQSLYFLSPSREQGLRAPRADVLLPGHFSGELAKRYTAMGLTALSCDYRMCEWGKGLHFRGDVRDVLFLHDWSLIVASMPCKDIARCDTTRRKEKLADGRCWFGMLLCIYIICAAGANGNKWAIALELPERTLLDKFWRAADQVVDLWWFGAPWRKATAFRTRNLPRLQATATCDNPSELPSLPQSVKIPYDEDKRDRERSRFVPELAEAITEQWNLETVQSFDEPLDFAHERDKAAQAFVDAGYTLPPGWDDPRARPPQGDAAARHLQDCTPRPREAGCDMLVSHPVQCPHGAVCIMRPADERHPFEPWCVELSLPCSRPECIADATAWWESTLDARGDGDDEGPQGGKKKAAPKQAGKKAPAGTKARLVDINEQDWFDDRGGPASPTQSWVECEHGAVRVDDGAGADHYPLTGGAPCTRADCVDEACRWYQEEHLPYPTRHLSLILSDHIDQICGPT